MKPYPKKWLACFFFTLVCIWIFPFAARGADYYVAPGGSGLGGPSDPFGSIQQGVDAAVPGDTIWVMDNNDNALVDFLEDVTVSTAGITIRAFDSDGTAPQIQPDPFGSGEVVILIQADNVTIQGLDVFNGTALAGIKVYQAGGCLITNNRVGWAGTYKNHYGIYLLECTTGTNTITNNICSYNDSSGIMVESSSNGNIIYGNTCSYNGGSGIKSLDSSGDTIRGNTCQGNSATGGGGVYLDSSTDTEVSQNTCSGNIFHGIAVHGDENRIYNNTCTGNGEDGITIFGIEASGNTVTANTCTANTGDGIEIHEGDRNMVSGNSLSNNGYGLNLRGGATDNMVVQNTVDQSGIGFWIESGAMGNRLFLNNLHTNTTNILDTSVSLGNAYVSPVKLAYLLGSDVVANKEVMGNRYSDYTGADADGNGIGDTTYIAGYASDTAPLAQAVANYGRKTWYLWSELMYEQDASKIGGTTTLVKNSPVVWSSSAAQTSAIYFGEGTQADETTWTGVLTFTSVPTAADTFEVAVGTYDGGTFTSHLDPQTISGDGSSRSVLFALSPSAFAVDTGQTLAVRITYTNSAGSSVAMRTGGAWSFISAPKGSGAQVIIPGAYYVQKSVGSDTNAGDAWGQDHALATIQKALDLVAEDPEAGPILVAAGTYNETLSLESASDITLLGGYPADGFGDADPEANPAIIAGTQGEDVVTFSQDTGITLDGFVIQGGAKGVYLAGCENVSIQNSTIQDNATNLYCETSSGLAISDNQIKDAKGGGGLFADQCAGTITKNVITGNSNTSAMGGGVYLEAPTAELILSENTISENSSSRDGGGVCAFQAASLSLEDNTISGNTASGSGGGIFCRQSPAVIQRNRITGNSGADDGFGGGIAVYGSGSPKITNNLISGNTGVAYGGGMATGSGATPVLFNNTIADNQASEKGGGVGSHDDGRAVIINSIVWGNSPNQLHQPASGLFAVRYSDIQGGFSGAGNISSNPIFADKVDYRLVQGSPCIDAATASGAPDHDLLMAYRPLDEGYDMGAYEGGLAASSVEDGQTISETGATVSGTVNNITVASGLVVNNTGGVINGLVLNSGSEVLGGTITGTVTGAQGSLITGALIDGDSISGVTIGAGCTITQPCAQANPGLDLLAAAASQTGDPLDLDHPILQENDGTLKTVADLIRDQCNAFLADTTTSTRPGTIGTVSITAANLGDSFVPAQITAIVTTAEPNTIRITPEGDLLVIRSGVAFTLSPYPADDDEFTAGLSQAGLTAEMDARGVVMVDLGGGVQVAVRFNNFATAGGATAVFSASTASFSVPSSDPASHAYTVLVSYSDGATQTMSPSVHDIFALSDLLTGFGFLYQFRGDGSLDLLGATGQTLWRGAPDLALRPAKTGVFDPYVQGVGDVDGNGMADYEFNTMAASQYVFAISF